MAPGGLLLLWELFPSPRSTRSHVCAHELCPTALPAGRSDVQVLSIPGRCSSPIASLSHFSSCLDVCRFRSPLPTHPTHFHQLSFVVKRNLVRLFESKIGSYALRPNSCKTCNNVSVNFFSNWFIRCFCCTGRNMKRSRKSVAESPTEFPWDQSRL